MAKKIFKASTTGISEKELFQLASKVITDNERLLIESEEILLMKFNKAYDTLKQASEQERY